MTSPSPDDMSKDMLICLAGGPLTTCTESCGNNRGRTCPAWSCEDQEEDGNG